MVAISEEESNLSDGGMPLQKSSLPIKLGKPSPEWWPTSHTVASKQSDVGSSFLAFHLRNPNFEHRLKLFGAFYTSPAVLTISRPPLQNVSHAL